MQTVLVWTLWLFSLLALCCLLWRLPKDYPKPDILLGIDLVAMAVLGGLVSAHAPGQRLWKILYGSTFVVLGCVGVRLVIQQSNEATIAQKEFHRELSEIASSAAETKRLQELNTILQSQLMEQGRTITGLAKETVAQITGGDSYMYFEPSGPLRINGGKILSNAVFKFVGKHPLHDVNVVVRNQTSGRVVLDQQSLGTVAPLEIGAKSHIMPSLVFNESDKSPQLFIVFIVTSNASIEEQIRFQKVGDKWMRAFRVYQRGLGERIHWMEAGFPADSIGTDWKQK